MAPSWERFGLYLNIPHDRLRGMRGCNSMVDNCFYDVLDMFVRNGGTIDQLVSALRYPGVDHGRLAKEVEKDKGK